MKCILIAAGLVMAGTPFAANAQEVVPGTSHGLAAMQTMSENEMKAATGGEEQPINIALASSQSSVTGNQIGNIGSTGAASANTVTNNSGLTTFIANTGNQVVISQSTIVNVFLH